VSGSYPGCALCGLDHTDRCASRCSRSICSPRSVVSPRSQPSEAMTRSRRAPSALAKVVEELLQLLAQRVRAAPVRIAATPRSSPRPAPGAAAPWSPGSAACRAEDLGRPRRRAHGRVREPQEHVGVRAHRTAHVHDRTTRPGRVRCARCGGGDLPGRAADRTDRAVRVEPSRWRACEPRDLAGGDVVEQGEQRCTRRVRPG